MVVLVAGRLGVFLRKLVWTAGGIWTLGAIPGEEKTLFSPPSTIVGWMLDEVQPTI